MTRLLTTKSLSLAIADEIASLAIEAATTQGFNPISICVMDSAGAEIVTKRMDGCPVSIVMYFVSFYHVTCWKILIQIPH